MLYISVMLIFCLLGVLMLRGLLDALAGLLAWAVTQPRAVVGTASWRRATATPFHPARQAR